MTEPNINTQALQDIPRRKQMKSKGMMELHKAKGNQSHSAMKPMNQAMMAKSGNSAPHAALSLLRKAKSARKG